MDLKFCKNCDNNYPKDENHWRISKNSRYRGGLSYRCKVKEAEYQNKYDKSEARKISSKKYRNSENGKIVRSRCSERYRNSKKGKTTKKAYLINNKEKYRFWAMTRHATKLQATPKWADLEAIKEFYMNCPPGYHVDHIIPLRGVNVCGLHVVDNLQYLTAEENLKKGNRIV